ncbi:unnamed protein product [Caenorhabditis auriculariae]|uniref:Uncharacterized protein n=1 Tax=Caenorhabditis auriculariae TaxID=2777116 RepID=A0A8S1GSY2_9PELO|nr:unnamed protein product [Caenorhabditis auriculariae]
MKRWLIGGRMAPGYCYQEASPASRHQIPLDFLSPFPALRNAFANGEFAEKRKRKEGKIRADNEELSVEVGEIRGEGAEKGEKQGSEEKK